MSTNTTTASDRIEKKVLLHAPRSRIWRALTDAAELGQWFGARLSGTISPGARIRGPVTHKDYEHLTFDVTIERVEPERLISWRWHPNPMDPDMDYSDEPTTLVTFELTEVEGGILLTVVESGFDAIPLARRADAYRGNDEGWAAQMENIRKHVD